MADWVASDPGAAMQWLHGKTESGEFEFKSLDGTSAADAAWGAAVAGLITTDQQAAIEAFAGLEKKAAEEALRQIAWGDAFDSLDRDVFVELARSMPSRGSEARAYEAYARTMARKESFEAAAKFVSSQSHLSEVHTANLMLATAKLFSQATPADARERLDWLVEKLPRRYAGSSIGEFLGSLSMNGHHRLAIESLEKLDGFEVRDKAVERFLGYSDWGTGRDELVALAESIEDPALRKKALVRGESE